MNIKTSLIKKEIKIIYVSGVNIETTEKENNLWQSNKERIIENFTVLDDEKFWANFCLRLSWVSLELALRIVMYTYPKIRNRFVKNTYIKIAKF